MNGGESTQQPATPPQPDADTMKNGDTPQPSGKVSQEQAQYQDQPKGDQRCDNCQHFVAENNTCGVVEGQISPQGWCSLWVKLA
ncbi:MAG: high-potential iron-sulfur protein [Gammaproteobacteria bacterium]|nr:high-potential iron-sulfur protein [Gammaproteobacteria bacterium]MBU1724266.1 high-potential iron-sulfur protein [Gammaproteobacteria bacterium]MBU2006306.1 high-potential iron-sulfur protein [Gammaproteobacteria bacterium]